MPISRITSVPGNAKVQETVNRPFVLSGVGHCLDQYSIDISFNIICVLNILNECVIVGRFSNVVFGMN